MIGVSTVTNILQFYWESPQGEAACTVITYMSSFWQLQCQTFVVHVSK